MIKLIVGKKGSGKTKTLVEMVNAATDKTNGSVICLEKGDKLKFDVSYKCRLIDTDEYFVKDGQSLYGFAAGILASNHDITDLFIDSALKICENDMGSFATLMDEVATLCEKSGVNAVVTASVAKEDIAESLEKYL